MKTFRLIGVGLFAVSICFSNISCSKDDDVYNQGSQNKEISDNKISKPVFDKDITTTTTDDISFRCRFTNGGDVNENMNCIVHWRRYAKKPSETPQTSDMQNHESMKLYKSYSKTKTTFDKWHGGFNGGNYIYYYFECSNSKYTANSNVSYHIIKR